MTAFAAESPLFWLLASLAVLLAGFSKAATGGGIAMMKGGIDYLKRGLQLNIQRDTPWVADMDTPNYTSCFAALDFVLRATSDDIVTNTSPGTLMDRFRNLFTK